jgi:hypothetical protein
MRSNTRRSLCRGAPGAVLIIQGCSQAPTFDILGSVFPAWLFCLVVGLLLTAVTRWLLVRNGINLLYPLLTYSCLAAIFIFTTWLVFFW